MLPGLLIRGIVDDADIDRIDAAALSLETAVGGRLQEVASNLRKTALDVGAALEAFSSSPDDVSRAGALAAVRALRALMQQAPKTVMLP